METINTKAEMVQQLRVWIYTRYGKWILWRTAASAIEFITECDEDGNKRVRK